MITLQENKNRGNAVKIIFYIMMGLDIVSAYSNMMQYKLLQLITGGTETSADMLSSNDQRQRIIAILMLLVTIGTIVTFIMWYYRAYKNLHALNINTLQFTPGWAIGAWFVPFLNLARPFMIMKEIWENTQYYVLQKEDVRRVSSTTIIGWWWAFWIGNNILGNASFRLSNSLNTANDYIFYTKFNIVSDVVDMVAMILTLIMVTRMMEYEATLEQYVNEQNNLPEVPVTQVISTDNTLNTTPE